MKSTPWLGVEQSRQHHAGRFSSRYGDDFGAFEIPYPMTGPILRVIASVGDGWDHVSVSTPLRCPPPWDEMEFIKRLFFKPTEAAMQLHVPVAEHRSMHPYCLHIWRPHDIGIPRPPGIMVAADEFLEKQSVEE